jgi:uncharacterized protein YegL
LHEWRVSPELPTTQQLQNHPDKQNYAMKKLHAESEAITMTTAFIDIDFADNPEPRVPTILLVDTSRSMSGKKIEALNLGLEQFACELAADTLARKRVDVAVISFGGNVSTVCHFTDAESFLAPTLQANGATPMGEAVVRAITMLEQRKMQYRAAGIAYYRPWLFLLTDGEPTDDGSHYWQDAVALVHEGEKKGKLSFFGVGVQEADMKRLNQLCPPKRPAMKLRGLCFRELFSWLSSSLKAVSCSTPGAASLTLPSSGGWSSVEL